jgi:pimeloyl-ACP methyl ester carboxylesterase
LRKLVVRLAIIIVILLSVIAGGFVLYTKLKTASPEAQALTAMESTERVAVSSDNWIVFKPRDGSLESGLIFYPGGLVDPRAYAPMARDIAAEGYPVVIVPMPFNLAVFGSGKATDVMKAFPDVEHWAVGGHSLGGAMASRYARQNPTSVSGLVLWAAYPSSSDDLSDSDVAVTSVYATLDGLASVEEIEDSRTLLPPDTRFVPIDGGNHAQFGWYGPQSGDNPAAISPSEQQAQIVAATVALLERMQSDEPKP